jgi:transcriptional regulator with XRE-family HTH domain
MGTKNKNIDPRILGITKKLKSLRKNRGYSSYEDFALEHNLDRKQYWRIENGANITLKTLLKILDIHNISLKDFFTDYK